MVVAQAHRRTADVVGFLGDLQDDTTPLTDGVSVMSTRR
jgi:hypothetical protein